MNKKVIAWRHDFHERPELGNHEKGSAAIIARYSQSLGIDARTGMVKTGVAGIIKRGLPGPVFALRDDMDYQPIEESVGSPFSSKVKEQSMDPDSRDIHACVPMPTWLY